MSHLLNRDSRGAAQSYSLNHNGAEDIKKGLQRIKQAQIEVLRQLRKDDPEVSKNYSLTYSKETTLDSKPTLKFDGQTSILKQKIQKLQHQLSQSIAKEGKMRKEWLQLTEEAKRSKQLCNKAEFKMKQYEKSEQRALGKAQQALANAITSEKKYISLKAEYDKIAKERQRLSNELKRIQKKEISDLINTHENESHIPNKIIRELASAQDTFHDLIREINNHKCVKKQISSSSNSKNQLPQQVQSVNSFTISTFETQQKLDKNINNIILYLNSLQNLAPILYESNNYMSGSFRDDIRKIEEELDHASKGKNQRIVELQNTNQQLTKRIAKLEGDLRETQEENGVLKGRIKQLAKEVEDLRVSKAVLDDQYEKFKIKTKEKEKMRDEELQDYRQRTKKVKTEQNDEYINRKGPVNSNNPESPEPFKMKISKLQQQNSILNQKLSSSLQHEQSLKQLIQKLQSQLESSTSQNKVLQTQQKHEMNKLNIRMQTESSFSKKSQQQWDEMIRAISRMQEQRIQFANRDKEMREQLENEGRRYRTHIGELERELGELRQHVEDARRESIAVSFDQTDLARLRNKENANRESLIFNKTVDELWNKKEGQYGNLNTLLEEIKPAQPELQPQNNFYLQHQGQPMTYRQNAPSNQVSLVQIHELNPYQNNFQSFPVQSHFPIQSNPMTQQFPMQYQQQQFVQPQQAYRMGYGQGYFVR